VQFGKTQKNDPQDLIYLNRMIVSPGAYYYCATACLSHFSSFYMHSVSNSQTLLKWTQLELINKVSWICRTQRIGTSKKKCKSNCLST